MKHTVPVAVEPVQLDTESPARVTVYESPAVIYEAPLEVRAGSPLSLPDPLDLTD